MSCLRTRDQQWSFSKSSKKFSKSLRLSWACTFFCRRRPRWRAGRDGPSDAAMISYSRCTIGEDTPFHRPSAQGLDRQWYSLGEQDFPFRRIPMCATVALAPWLNFLPLFSEEGPRMVICVEADLSHWSNFSRSPQFSRASILAPPT